MTTTKDEDARRPARERESVWLRQVPGRGRRASTKGTTGVGSLDLERIVTAAVQLLDSEGEAQFSMRRLAAHLKVTPMSVYWYVRGKEDLLELALDAIIGQIPLPHASAERYWQDDLLALALAWRRTMLARPWALRCYGEFLGIGPQHVRFSAHVQDVIARSPLPETLRPAALSAVLRFIYGYTSVESAGTAHGHEATGGTNEPATGQDFARGLSWLVAGISTDTPLRR